VDVDQILENKNVAASYKKKGYMQRKKEDFEKEEFKKILSEYKEEKDKVSHMEHEAQQQYE